MKLLDAHGVWINQVMLYAIQRIPNKKYNLPRRIKNGKWALIL